MERLGPRFLVVLTLCLSLVAPRAAHADAATARAHFDKGRAYFQVDDYRKAIDEFKAAHVQKPDPAFLYNIAECYRHLGEVQDALTFYRRFLSVAPSNDRSRPAVEKRVAELQKAAREPKAPSPEPQPAPPQPATPPPALAPAPADAPVTVLVGEPPPPAETRPFYKRGWFIATAAAVVVVGAGIGIWAATRSPGAPETPLGNQNAF